MRLMNFSRKNICRFTLAVAILSLGAITAFAEPKGERGVGPSELFADSVHYDVNAETIQAKGNVVMTTTDGKATGDYAEYHLTDQTGSLKGHVVADRLDMHLVCDELISDKPEHFIAIGNVHAKKGTRTYDGPRVEYFQAQDYLRMEEGGVVKDEADGSTFIAKYMEGWPKKEHFKGRGDCHIISTPKDFEGGGDEAEYFGEDNGRTILTGNAWAIQGENHLKSKVITAYLNDPKGERAKKDAN